MRTLIDPADVEVGMTISSVFTGNQIECTHTGPVAEVMPDFMGFPQVRLHKAIYTQGPVGEEPTRTDHDEGDCLVRLGSDLPTVNVQVFVHDPVE